MLLRFVKFNLYLSHHLDFTSICFNSKGKTNKNKVQPPTHTHTVCKEKHTNSFFARLSQRYHTDGGTNGLVEYTRERKNKPKKRDFGSWDKSKREKFTSTTYYFFINRLLSFCLQLLLELVKSVINPCSWRMLGGRRNQFGWVNLFFVAKFFLLSAFVLGCK